MEANPQAANIGDPIFTGNRDNLDRLENEHFLAEMTGRSLASIRRDRQRGTGCPFVRIGCSVRYKRSAIAGYIASLSARG
jgi:hypothetical protein